MRKKERRMMMDELGGNKRAALIYRMSLKLQGGGFSFRTFTSKRLETKERQAVSKKKISDIR